MFLTISEDGGKITSFGVSLQRGHTIYYSPEGNSLASTQYLRFLEFALETY